MEARSLIPNQPAPRFPLLPAEFRRTLACRYESLARGLIGSQHGLKVGDLSAQCLRQDARADAYAQFRTDRMDSENLCLIPVERNLVLLAVNHDVLCVRCH